MDSSQIESSAANLVLLSGQKLNALFMEVKTLEMRILQAEININQINNKWTVGTKAFGVSMKQGDAEIIWGQLKQLISILPAVRAIVFTISSKLGTYNLQPPVDSNSSSDFPESIFSPLPKVIGSSLTTKTTDTTIVTNSLSNSSTNVSLPVIPVPTPSLKLVRVESLAKTKTNNPPINEWEISQGKLMELKLMRLSEKDIQNCSPAYSENVQNKTLEDDQQLVDTEEVRDNYESENEAYNGQPSDPELKTDNLPKKETNALQKPHSTPLNPVLVLTYLPPTAEDNAKIKITPKCPLPSIYKAKLHQCPKEDCSISFTNQPKLKKHIREDHLSTEKVGYQCPCCPNIIETKRFFVMHMDRQHPEKEITPDIFSNFTFLKRKICSKEVKSKRSMSFHMVARHSDKRDFVCSECGKAFKTPKLMHAHIILVHTNSQGIS